MLKYILSLAILLLTVLAYIILKFVEISSAEFYLIIMLAIDAIAIFLVLKKVK